MDSDIKFIKAVEDNPCLYNKQHPDFKTKDKKTKVWNAIAKQCQLRDNEAAQNKWRYMRDKFSREKRRRSNIITANEMSEHWILYEQMLFLEDFVLPRKINKDKKYEKTPEYLKADYDLFVKTEESPEFCNTFDFDSAPITSRSLSHSQSSHSTSAPKLSRRLGSIECSSNSQVTSVFETTVKSSGSYLGSKAHDDSDVHFCNFLASEMRKMTSNKKRRLQVTIMNAILDLEDTIIK